MADRDSGWVGLKDGYVKSPWTYFSEYMGKTSEDRARLAKRKNRHTVVDGEEVALQDWKGRVAIKDPKQARKILKRVLPILREEGVHHKVAASPRSWNALNEVSEEPHSTLDMGKSVTIYRPHDMSAEGFVTLLDRVDVALRQKGLEGKGVTGSPIADRRIGRSGLVSYRYASAGLDGFFIGEDPIHIDLKKGKVVDISKERSGFAYYPDRRTPGLYATPDKFGDDEIERIAKKRGMYVEPVHAMVDRVRFQLRELSHGSKGLDSLRENRRKFLIAMGALHKHGKLSLKDAELKRAEIARDFHSLYNALFDFHLKLDSKGDRFDDEPVRQLIGEYFEDPLLDGRKHREEDFERIPAEHGIRQRVRRIAAKHAR